MVYNFSPELENLHAPQLHYTRTLGEVFRSCHWPLVGEVDIDPSLEASRGRLRKVGASRGQYYMAWYSHGAVSWMLRGPEHLAHHNI